MLYARLDKTGTRVLCGAGSCGGQEALVIQLRDLERRSHRYVWFGPGWQRRPDGVWERTRDRHRGPPGYRSLDTGPWPTGLLPPSVPVVAVCPRCGFVQTLSAERLQVVEYVTLDIAMLYPQLAGSFSMARKPDYLYVELSLDIYPSIYIPHERMAELIKRAWRLAQRT